MKILVIERVTLSRRRDKKKKLRAKRRRFTEKINSLLRKYTNITKNLALKCLPNNLSAVYFAFFYRKFLEGAFYYKLIN